MKQFFVSERCYDSIKFFKVLQTFIQSVTVNKIHATTAKYIFFFSNFDKSHLQIILKEVISLRFVAQIVFAPVFLVGVTNRLYVGCRGIVLHHGNRKGLLGGFVGGAEQIAEAGRKQAITIVHRK